MDTDTATSLLPSKVSQAVRKPERLKYFIIGEPKWGKTTFFTSVDNCLLLAFEEGHAFTSAFKICVDVWDRNLRERKLGWTKDDDEVTHTSAIEAIEALESYCPYDFIIIDTADMASKMCTDYSCRVAGVSHPSDGGDFGKGWATLQTDPFRQFVNRILKLGVGVAFISHVNVIEKKNPKTGLVDSRRRESTLPSGIQKFIHTQADVIINASFGTKRPGQYERDRIISFDGSAEVLAGVRVRGVYIPKKYVVAPPTDEEPNASWEQWVSFFEDSPDAGQTAEEEFINLSAKKPKASGEKPAEPAVVEETTEGED